MLGELFKYTKLIRKVKFNISAVQITFLHCKEFYCRISIEMVFALKRFGTGAKMKITMLKQLLCIVNIYKVEFTDSKHCFFVFKECFSLPFRWFSMIKVSSNVSAQTTNKFGKFILVADSDHFLDDWAKGILSSILSSMHRTPNWTK